MILYLPEKFQDGTQTRFKELYEQGRKSHHMVNRRNSMRPWLPGNPIHAWIHSPTRKERSNPDLFSSIYWWDSARCKTLKASQVITEDVKGYTLEEPMPVDSFCPVVYAMEEVEVFSASHQVKVGGLLLTEDQLSILMKREGHSNAMRFFHTFGNIGGRPWRGNILHWGNRLYNPPKAKLFLL